MNSSTPSNATCRPANTPPPAGAAPITVSPSAHRTAIEASAGLCSRRDGDALIARCLGGARLALIAATKVHARIHPNIKVNAFCPGYCDTDMSSHRGTRPPATGAQIGVLLATMENSPTGAFYEDMRPSEW